MRQKTLFEILGENTKKGELFERLPERRVRCYACAHRCLIADGKAGICLMRLNQGGELYVPHGYVAGLHDDPIEKKPFYHVLSGAYAMSFGMLGCDFHCGYCQNWITSQALRDSSAVSSIMKIKAEEIVKLALERNCRVVTSTYNEPLITTEWAVEVFKEAKKRGLVTSYVSNGYATPEVLDYLRPWLDAYKVDLKGFDDNHYRELGGSLDVVCQTIRGLHERHIWVEIVTLLVPGFNDSQDELKSLTEFVASVSPDIPWHVTAFHQDYDMTEYRDTSPEDLLRAVDIGKKAGLRYVYAGNLPGTVGEWESTYCHHCGDILVKRSGFRVLQNQIASREGKCIKCGTRIPGFWIKN
ncbi:MAG: AmmeMemoRadiSam system radical SAM enzyme [Candidatus Omnitrophica bacterium]|nr:AmmeMemoRadiSam system radical SAM enzyme [Candidatus Omnitrophota bacterium]